MSMHSLQHKLENADFTGTFRGFFVPGSGYYLGWGATVGNSVENWAKGALFIDTDASTGAQFWINTGTSSAASFKAISSLDAANTWAAAQTFSAAATFSAGFTSTTAPTFSAGYINGYDNLVSSADLAKTSNTTLADITGLSTTVAASGVYSFNGVLYVTNTANGGLKVSTAGGTATVTSIVCDAEAWNGSTVGTTTRTTSLTNIHAVTAEVVTKLYITGAMVVNAGGTFKLQAAQNASHADTTTVLQNSWLSLRRKS